MESLIDFQRVMTALSRNRWIIAGIIVFALLLGAAITLLTTPRYTAEASLMINQQSDRVLSTEQVEPTVLPQDTERFLQTQVDILESRHLALRVIENERLLDNPDFLARAGIEVNPELEAEAGENVLRQAAINHLLANTEVTPPLDSRIVTVSYTSPSAEFAAQIANAYVETFIRDNLDRRAESSRYAREFLSTRLAEAKVRLEESERELNQFAQASGIVNVATSETESDGQGTTTTSRSLLRLNDAAADAEAARAAAEARWRSAAGSPAAQLPEVVSNSAYQTLLAERARVQGQLSEELATRQEEYPTVQALRSQLESINGQIASVGGNIKQSIRENYEAAVRQESELESRVNELKGEFLAEDSRGVQYGIFAREVDTNRVIYDGLLQRFKEVSAEEGLTSNNVSRVDVATPPLRPSVPNTFINMGLALVAGIVLAALVTFLREVVDDIVRTPADVEERFGLPTLGIIPQVPEGEEMEEALLDPKSEVSEAIHSLRTSVLLALANSGRKVAMASSSEASEGKSTTMVALARDMALLGKRVLLVDADLRRPRLHKIFDIPNRAGLSDMIAGSASETETVQKLPAPYGFDFLTSGTEVVDPATLLNSDRLSELADQFSEHYDVILIDGPPVLGLADGPNLASKLGNVLFVMESGRIHARRARMAKRRLTDAGARILGVVLTKVDFRKMSSGYAYEYGYSQSYYNYTKEG